MAAEVFEKPQIIVHVEKSVNFTLFDAKWIPRSCRFVVSGSRPNGSGALCIYELNKSDIVQNCDVIKADAIKCSTFGASNLMARRIATGDFKGNLNVYDVEQLNASPTYSVLKAHDEIINCIDGVGGLLIGEGAPELVTGSRDGSVKVWDERQPDKPVVKMASSESTRDCWAVAFGNAHSVEDRCVAAGYDNGDIKLFDLRNMGLLWEKNIGNGVCSLQFDRKDIVMNKLVATTLESRFHLFDMRTQHPTKGFSSLSEKAHKSTVWSVSHLPQKRDIFMTSGGNGSLFLWQYNYPSHRVKEVNNEKEGVLGTVSCLQNVILSSQPLGSFDWSLDKEGLGVCTSFDQNLRVVVVTKLKLVN